MEDSMKKISASRVTFLGVLLFVVFAFCPIRVSAATKSMPDGGLFDPDFYATSYPDVVACLGKSESVLYNHYLLFGKAEGRLPYASAPVVTTVNTAFDPVYYASRYPDVAAVLGNNAAALKNHYDLFGKAEGRYPNMEAELGAYSYSAFELEMLRQINEYRAATGIQPLQLNPICSQVAKVRAKECSQWCFHTRPDGQLYYTVYAELGYHGIFHHVNENLYSCATPFTFTPESDYAVLASNAMAGFKGSPGHNAEMLSPIYQYVGFSYYYKVHGKITELYVVQEFAEKK